MDDDVEKNVGLECFSIRVCDYLGGRPSSRGRDSFKFKVPTEVNI